LTLAATLVYRKSVRTCSAPYSKAREATVSDWNDDTLAKQLAARAADVPATVAYSVVPLDGGPAISAHGDARLPTASTFKVYLLAALYAADAAGRLSLDERVEYRAEDHTRGSGVLKLMAPGLAPTLRDHARLMIVISDNVSTNIVMRALGGPEAAHAAVQALPIALPATEVRGYISFETVSPDGIAVSSPNDFTALLGAIYHGRCTGSAAHDAEIYWTLRRQQHRSMIPRYLPCSEYAEEFGVEEYNRCGNKTGSMPGVRADVGIVESRKRAWTIAVQIRGEPDFNTGDDHPFNQVVADLSKLVFEAWARDRRAAQ
jgi:beta-lactamase class A